MGERAGEARALERRMSQCPLVPGALDLGRDDRRTRARELSLENIFEAVRTAGPRTRRHDQRAPTDAPLERTRELVAEAVALAQRLEEMAVGVGADHVKC